MSRKKRSISKSKILMTVITAIFIGLIFLQSALPANASNAESEGFTTFINNFLISLKLNITLSHAFIRKLAHFSEFFVLGILLTATTGKYISKPYRGTFSILFFGLATAVCDETIQLYVAGRAGILQDVLIDFSGVAAGVGITLLILAIKNAFK